MSLITHTIVQLYCTPKTYLGYVSLPPPLACYQCFPLNHPHPWHTDRMVQQYPSFWNQVTNERKVQFYSRYEDTVLGHWKINCNHHHLKMTVFWLPSLWSGREAITHCSKALGMSSNYTATFTVKSGKPAGCLVHCGLQEAGPHRKNVAAKRSGKQGRQVTGLDFSADQGYETHPASIPRSKLWICSCTDCCNEWWPLYQARCKVAMQVILKCWWLLSTWRLAVRGFWEPKGTQKKEFYRDFIENIRQDIAASVNRQYF